MFPKFEAIVAYCSLLLLGLATLCRGEQLIFPGLNLDLFGDSIAEVGLQPLSRMENTNPTKLKKSSTA